MANDNQDDLLALYDGAVEQEDTEADQGLLSRAGDVALDIGKGVVGGVRDGLQETGETIQWAAESAGNFVTRGHDVYYTEDDGLEWLTEEEVSQRDDVPAWQTKDLIGETLALPEVGANETVAGGLVRGVTQFATGYVALGSALKGAKAVSTLSKGRVVANAATKGAVVDFATFDAHEARFSDLLRDTVGLSDPITEYLASDEDDSTLEGKLKNAIEGIGMGIATDSLVLIMAKALKKARKVKVSEGPEAAAKVMNDVVEEQADLFDALTDPNLRTEEAAGPTKVIVKGGKADPEGINPKTGKPNAKTVTEHNARKVPARDEPSKPMDVAEFQAAIDYEVGLVKGGSIPDPNRHLVGKLFNFDKMDADATTLDYLNMASDAVPDSLLKDKTTFDKMNAEARIFLADSINVSPEIIDGSLANMAKNMKKQQGIVIAGKQLVQSLSREVETLAQRIATGAASDADYAKMVRLQARTIEVSGNLKSVITGAAQTTSAGRIRTMDAVTGQQLAQADITTQLLDSIDAAGGRDAVRKLADEIVMSVNAGNGVAGTMRVTANKQATGFWAVVNELRINGILSGPKTLMIDGMSNTLQTVRLPAERILGGALAGDRVMMREGGMMYVGIAHAVKDSLKMAKIAAARGRNILDPEAAILEANGSDFRAIQSTSDNALVRNFVNGLGFTIRLPSRALLTGDEFFKQINYRADLYARLNTHVLDLVESGKVSDKDAAKWVADRMETGFGKDGQATSKQSLDFGREATFTNELRKGSVAKDIQNFTNRHPAMKLILPFVRTPTNLVVAGIQRTPILHMTSKNMMADLRSGNPSRVAAARGKLATGTLLWSGAITAAVSGQVTGSGPVDPVQKARLMETGWRPYSYKTAEGKYISYERLDPFAMFMGIAADFVEIGGQIGEAEGKNIAVAGFAAVANNVMSKTWLRGITDFVDAMASPERKGERYLQSMASSFVPYSSLIREVRKGTDPTMRDTKGDPNAGFLEMQSIVNAIKNTLPGYSETLPMKRSWVTGEPVQYPKGWGQDMPSPLGEAFASMNPIYEGTWKKDMVLDELANFDAALSPPTREIRGVQLTPEQFAVYSELHGKVRPNGTGRTMYEELEYRFSQPDYDLKRDRVGNASDPTEDFRLRIVRRVTTAYRNLAKEEMMRRFPDIKAEVAANNMDLRQHRNSVLTGVTDLAGE